MKVYKVTGTSTVEISDRKMEKLEEEASRWCLDFERYLEEYIIEVAEIIEDVVIELVEERKESTNEED